MDVDAFIERHICIGIITSTEYLQTIRPICKVNLLESPTAKVLCTWVLEYFDEYGRAPGKDIETIYTTKLKGGLGKEPAEWIAEVLENLSDASIDTPINTQYLLDQTKEYFRQQSLRKLAEDIQFELEKGKTKTAEDLLLEYNPLQLDVATFIDPFSSVAKDCVFKAFSEREEPLIKFPKALGAFWNRELVRGGFVSIMGAEKRGKSMLLIELAMRALKSGSSVAFFQAGDMTEPQQLRRIAIYLTERSDEDRYCRGQWIPEVDCILHQLDICDKDCREGDALLFKNEKEICYDSLVRAANENPDHKPCHNCKDMKGTAWLRWRKGEQPLVAEHAYVALRKFGRKHKARFRLSTHSNGTLSVKGIKGLLSQWKKQEDFQPDVIIIDYADLLVTSDTRLDFRHQQNRIWQGLRNLSQEMNALVVTVTQIAARGYSKTLLSMDDFSEDKRKFSHVTAMYGLNQTPEEKRIGILRINELVVREADFDPSRPVSILQRLQIGRPFLGSWR